MITQLVKKIRINPENFELNKILFLFRFASFMVTSLFFMGNGMLNHMGEKIFIVCCIGMASVLFNYLYTNHLDNSRIIVLLFLIETGFNVYILVPSGGLNSPYIWYSMNTILVSSLVLNKTIYCWINLFTYIFSSTWVISTVFEMHLQEIFLNKANLLLSLIIITAAIQILVGCNRKIRDKNHVLIEANSKVLSANHKIKQSMNLNMQMYKAAHFLTSQSDEANLLNLIVEYSVKITKSDKVFFVKNGNPGEALVAKCNSTDTEEQNKLKAEVTRMLMPFRNMKTIGCIESGDQYWMIAPVKCFSEIFGVIGIQLTEGKSDNDEVDTADQLSFLSELATTALERFQLEEVSARLLVSKEQNRIANEIHDGVLQNLFTISCGLYGLTKRSGSLSAKKIASELTMIQSTLNKAMGDLRSTIYGYSWKQRGTSNFLTDVQSVINSIKKYHGVDIIFELIGDHELLSSEHKKAFYRIITEGMANSVRHGKAKNISIIMSIGLKDALLKIVDNGIGFDLNLLSWASKNGMGLHSIKLLAKSLKGNLTLDSEVGKGTTLSIQVPVGNSIYKEESVV